MRKLNLSYYPLPTTHELTCGYVHVANEVIRNYYRTYQRMIDKTFYQQKVQEAWQTIPDPFIYSTWNEPKWAQIANVMDHNLQGIVFYMFLKHYPPEMINDMITLYHPLFGELEIESYFAPHRNIIVEKIDVDWQLIAAICGCKVQWNPMEDLEHAMSQAPMNAHMHMDFARATTHGFKYDMDTDTYIKEEVDTRRFNFP